MALVIAPVFRGKNPKKWKGVAGSPETESAAVTEEGPLTTWTGMLEA
jgi:hypothetical protein